MVLVKSYAFQKRRSESTVKHTGVRLTITDKGGLTSHHVFEVNGSLTSPCSWDTKHFEEVSLRKERPTELKSYKHLVPIAEFEDDAATTQEFLESPLFSTCWNYNAFKNNCRDHVVGFCHSLRQRRVKVNSYVEKWLRGIRAAEVTSVVLLGTAAVASIGLGIAALVCAVPVLLAASLAAGLVLCSIVGSAFVSWLVTSQKPAQ